MFFTWVHRNGEKCPAENNWPLHTVGGSSLCIRVMLCQVSIFHTKPLKVTSNKGIWLAHLEFGNPDSTSSEPLCLVVRSIQHLQGDSTSHHRFPDTINVLRTLK